MLFPLLEQEDSRGSRKGEQAGYIELAEIHLPNGTEVALHKSALERQITSTVVFSLSLPKVPAVGGSNFICVFTSLYRGSNPSN